MRFLSEDEVRQSLEPDELIRAIRAVFAREDRSTLRMPVRTRLELSGCVLLLMPCYDSALHAAGVKLVTVSAQAGIRASYALLDPVNGEMQALMEADTLTDLRTAATSAVATDALARQDASTLGIFGAGRQAAAHFAVLPRVRSFRRFLVCGSGRSDLHHFQRKMKHEHGIEIEAADAETCARSADVICTCTTSSEPVFDGRWLRVGAHLNLIGGFRQHAREVDDETVRKARIVVDTYDGALAEAGDLLVPLEKGVIDRRHIIGDLHEIVSGKRTGRDGSADITLFKSVGCAIEDLVAAKLVSADLP